MTWQTMTAGPCLEVSGVSPHQPRPREVATCRRTRLQRRHRDRRRHRDWWRHVRLRCHRNFAATAAAAATAANAAATVARASRQAPRARPNARPTHSSSILERHPSLVSEVHVM